MHPRIHRVPLLVPLLLLVAAGSADAAESLRTRLDQALTASGLRGARVAALVVARDDGRELYAREPDQALVPASNLKVLTALGVLSAFGPAHRFHTEVLVDALPAADGSVGRLYVRGGGDPSMTSEQWWRLAADLRARGLRRIRGEIVLDDSHFDRDRWHPVWGETSSRAYHAPVGALSANYGAFEVWVDAGAAPGDPLRVRVDPPVPYLEVVNRGQTGPAGGRTRLRVDREPAGAVERVLVTGTLPAGRVGRRYARSVVDPARYAGAVLRMQLDALGIVVDGPTVLGRVPEPAVQLHDFEGLPLGEVMRRFMKWSNNAIGETLVKALGAHEQGEPGTWSKGIPALRGRLGALGLDTEGLALADGSGLAYTNRASPRLLVDALRTARGSFGFGPEFETSLPIAAVDGTLRERAEDAEGSVRAKTGLLTRVTGLSGFARRTGGDDVVFSILVNGYRGSAESAMKALDGFVEVLVETPPRQAAAGR